MLSKTEAKMAAYESFLERGGAVGAKYLGLRPVKGGGGAKS